jgi:hypothetical protein
METKVVHFLKKQVPTKVHSTVLIFKLFWYHEFNGNKVHVLKEIKFTLIGAQLNIPNIYTSREKQLKFEVKATMLGTYGSILTIQKSLIRIRL